MTTLYRTLYILRFECLLSLYCHTVHVPTLCSIFPDSPHLPIEMHLLLQSKYIPSYWNASPPHLHHFVWESNPKEVLEDYRMTHVTFGVCLIFCNQHGKMLSIMHVYEYPLAADVVEKTFYIDDHLSGTENCKTAIKLQHNLFNCGFLLEIPMTLLFSKAFLKTSKIHMKFIWSLRQMSTLER